MNWRVLTTAIFCTILFSVDGSIVNIALPKLASDLGVGTSEASFVPTAYFITISSTMLLVVALFGRFGLKRTILAGYGIFIAASFLCAVAPGIWSLVAARVLQGLGGSILLMAAFTLVPRYIAPERSGYALGFISASLAVGIAAGYPLGGMLSLHFGWRSVFYFLVPVSIVWMVYAGFALPSDRPEGPRKSFDIAGTLALFICLASFTFAISMSEHYGWGSPIILASFVVSAVSAGAFVRVEKRAANPLLDLEIFSSRQYSKTLLSRLFAAVMQNGNMFILPFLLTYVNRLEADQAGLVIGSYSVLYILLAPVSGTLADRFSPVRVSLVSLIVLLIVSAGFVSYFESGGVPFIMVFLSFLAAGFALFYPANNKLMIMLCPPEQRGLSVGVFLTVWIIGLSLGVSLFEFVFSTGMSITEHHEQLLAGRIAHAHAEELIGAFRLSYAAGALAILIALTLFIASLRRAPTSEPSGSVAPSPGG